MLYHLLIPWDTVQKLARGRLGRTGWFRTGFDQVLADELHLWRWHLTHENDM